MKRYLVIALICWLAKTAQSQNNLSVTLSKSDERCYKGTAAVSVSGTSSVAHIKWSTGDTTATINHLVAGNYSVEVQADPQDTVINFSIEHADCEVAISNHFTPNDDGFNDTWSIQNTSFYPDFELIVFNRWGQQVYKQSGQYVPWDGKALGIMLPDATYYYVFYFDKHSKDKILKGDVSILR